MNENITMPFDIEETLVQVFFQYGDVPFVCGVIGRINSQKISELDCQLSTDYQSGDAHLFNNYGNGDYLLKIKYEKGELDGESAQWIHRPYFDYELVKFEPCEYVDSLEPSCP